MTFDEMNKIEPRLGKLRDEAVKKMANSPGTYAKRSSFWYHELKPRFKYLVGFMAKNPALETCEAFDIAYMELCKILKVW